MKKLHFVFDNTQKNLKLKNIIFKKEKNYPLKKSNVITVLGGDGFMLQTLKKYKKFRKPFYGINTGTYGFLMNKLNLRNLNKNISKAKSITISPLEMVVKTMNNKKFTAIAINEVSLLRQSKQTASIKIYNNKKVLIKKLVCDGVLISTPAGSTAYNLSAYGPILSLNSKKIALTPINPFRPRRWKSKILSSSAFIKIKNLNIKKRPISVVADNKEFRNVKFVSIKVNNNIKFKLLHDKNYSLAKKIKLEQIKLNTY